MTTEFPVVETLLTATVLAQYWSTVGGSIRILGTYAKGWVAETNWGTVYPRN